MKSEPLHFHGWSQNTLRAGNVFIQLFEELYKQFLSTQRVQEHCPWSEMWIKPVIRDTERAAYLCLFPVALCATSSTKEGLINTQAPCLHVLEQLWHLIADLLVCAPVPAWHLQLSWWAFQPQTAMQRNIPWLTQLKVHCGLRRPELLFLPPYLPSPFIQRPEIFNNFPWWQWGR